MLDLLIIYTIGHAVNPVFHAPRSKNQIYIFDLKFLAVVLYMYPKASSALDLGSDHLLLSKGCMRLKAHLLPEWNLVNGTNPQWALRSICFLSWVST